MKVNIIERVLIITISNFNESEERGTLRFHAGLYDSLEFRRFAWPCAPLHPPSMAEAVEQVDRVEQVALAGGTDTEHPTQFNPNRNSFNNQKDSQTHSLASHDQ